MKIKHEIEVKILTLQFDYIVIETKYTRHHIERLMPTCKDHGRIKWIAESKPEMYEAVKNYDDEEAQLSHIDRNDMFPRLYFSPNAFLNEMQCWLNARGLEVTKSYEGEV